MPARANADISCTANTAGDAACLPSHPFGESIKECLRLRELGNERRRQVSLEVLVRTPDCAGLAEYYLPKAVDLALEYSATSQIDPLDLVNEGIADFCRWLDKQVASGTLHTRAVPPAATDILRGAMERMAERERAEPPQLPLEAETVERTVARASDSVHRASSTRANLRCVLEDALESLSSRHIDRVYTLRVWSGVSPWGCEHSLRETAAIFNITPTAVHLRIGKALEQLKRDPNVRELGDEMGMTGKTETEAEDRHGDVAGGTPDAPLTAFE